MANSKVKTNLRKTQTRSYLNKDFDGFKNDLLLYARTFFDDQIQDFSEASVGGLLLDMAAYVGDVMSYYLDHQLSELNIETAVETKNIEKIIRTAGIKITGASPAVVDLDFYIEVPADSDDTNKVKASSLPKILAGTTVSSNSGVLFELLEDVDFAEIDSDGNYLHTKTVGSTQSDGVTPKTYILKNGREREQGISQDGTARSGKIIEEKVNIPNIFVPFRTVTLGSNNISEIISIKDTEGNPYHEVESLSQNVVYKRTLNVDPDSMSVPDTLELIPAPFRFMANASRQTGLTTIRFGSGQADSTDDDIIPDPSQLSLPLYEKTTFARFSIDPNNLLKTSTLGISPLNTTLTIRYRAGGGLTHNVSANSIRSITGMLMRFPSTAAADDIASVRASLEVNNTLSAQGGENPPTLNELRSHVLTSRFAQSRVVTKEDLIARIYTMPSNFGRVFRVGVRKNENNPMSANLYVISRDINGRLVVSADSLKKNLVTYLNSLRLIADSIDILDTAVINIGVNYNIVIDDTFNKRIVIQQVNNSLKEYLDIKNFQIDQPLIRSDLITIILAIEGVVSLDSLSLTSLSGTVNGRTYTDVSTFDTDLNGPNYDRGVLYGPPGSIFELRFPDDDIIGNSI
jgi:hypothetical protein